MKTKEQIKATIGHWDEEESRLIDGLVGTTLLMGGALCWFIIGSIVLYFQTELGFCFIGIGALMTAVWVCIHVFPRVWKWILSLVE